MAKEIKNQPPAKPAKPEKTTAQIIEELEVENNILKDALAESREQLNFYKRITSSSLSVHALVPNLMLSNNIPFEPYDHAGVIKWAIDRATRLRLELLKIIEAERESANDKPAGT